MKGNGAENRMGEMLKKPHKKTKKMTAGQGPRERPNTVRRQEKAASANT